MAVHTTELSAISDDPIIDNHTAALFQKEQIFDKAKGIAGFCFCSPRD
jgi:hypothetical protein